VDEGKIAGEPEMEIEKKYLVKELPERLEAFSHSRLTQSYISRNPVIRLRKIETEQGCSYVLTVKGEGLSVRQEFELPLTREAYEDLSRKTEGRILEKVRYRIPLAQGYTAELDQFEGELSGLILVEVEFPSEAEMNAFVPPVWFGEDVSESRKYHNSVLSEG
jgi:adenylate cyclase